MTIYALLIIIFWLIFVLVWFISAFTTKKGTWGSPKFIFVRVAVILVILFFLHERFPSAFGSFHIVAAAHPVLNLIGMIICGTGIGFAIWARFHLGKNWGMPMTVREKPELVTSGPYRYVRHPIYTGVILAMLGSGLVSNVLWLVILFFYSFYFIYSAKKEEVQMLKIFPDRYPHYMKQTKMLIPFIY